MIHTIRRYMEANLYVLRHSPVREWRSGLSHNWGTFRFYMGWG